MTKYMLVFFLLFLQRYGTVVAVPFLRRDLTLSMVGDEKCLAIAKDELGSLERIKRLVRLNVIQWTTPEFTDHAKVADGASDFFGQLFGPDNSHARMVQGATSLPGGYTVVVEMIFEISL
jgi:hypothetical protein